VYDKETLPILVQLVSGYAKVCLRRGHRLSQQFLLGARWANSLYIRNTSQHLMANCDILSEQNKILPEPERN